MGQDSYEVKNLNVVNDIEKEIYRIHNKIEKSQLEESYNDYSRLSKIKNMINNIENELEKIPKLKNDIDKLQDENISLKNENILLKNENILLKNENILLRNENILLKNENISLKKENNTSKKENNTLKNKNNDKFDNKVETQIINENNYFNKNIFDLKNQVLKNQKDKMKNVGKKSGMLEQNKNIKLNQLLEDMCIYGNIVYKEIKKIKNNNNNNIITTNDALKLEKNDQGLFALGLLAHNLENNGIKTIIEKSNIKGNEDEEITNLQFISNGLIFKKKYDLHFEFGNKRNNELLNNKNEYEKFKNNLKLKLSKDFNIPIDEIIVTYPYKGSFHVQIIFQSDEFNNLNLDEFKKKFQKDKEFLELTNLKEIHEDVNMSACKLSKNQLDPRGNRSDGWGVGEKRGNKDYFPPLGWIGIGLKVLDKYENNKWIGMNNDPDEWCVAYHGVGQNEKISKNVKRITGLIFKGNFKPGSGQVHKDCSDKYHNGKKVGVGVYCTPNIEIAESYAGVSNINGKNYKTVLMVRVKPDSIRCCNDHDYAKDYWVVNGTNDEIRPYRILYKCN